MQITHILVVVHGRRIDMSLREILFIVLIVMIVITICSLLLERYHVATTGHLSGTNVVLILLELAMIVFLVWGISVGIIYDMI